MEDDTEILMEKDVNVKGAVLIEGFPSVGMVSSIVANYMIKTLKMEYVGCIRSRHFQPTAVISDGVPMPPVRIYAGQPVEKKNCICEQLLVITSDFPPPVELILPMAQKLLDWKAKAGIKTIVSIEGIVNVSKKPDEHGTYAIGSTGPARKMLEDGKMAPLKNGIITGISGVLLHEAERTGRNVVCLLADANPQIPDARAAAKLIELLDAFLPGTKLDPAPLIQEAERLESHLKEAVMQAGALNTPKKGDQMMYG